ncbi:MAG TPA: MBL fold metallo-hydrolase [Gammaproteobacteria bacterium]|nr:MBL fold metallo-hydrolase [Gammaproteobacteria bacterium]
MSARTVLALSTVLLPAALAAQPRTTLDIYVIDVEGGNATLFVAPSGESLLIDTGNGGQAAARDAGRIMAAVQDAGLERIDHLITTHYHGDHFGAMSELAGRIPIAEFIDHGPNVQANPATDAFLNDVYPALYAKSKHTVVKPGDRVAVRGVDVRIVASAGEAIRDAVPGAGQPNPLCATHQPKDADPGENAQSVGSHFTFGRFRALHLGDLTWNKEFALACPRNLLGTVDVFVVTHHGQPVSNPPVLVHALAPRVAIMNNGTRKGGQPDAMKVLFSSPGLEDLWQLHFSLLSGQEFTVPGAFIANVVDEQPASLPIEPIAAPAPGPGATPPPAHNGPAFWIKVAARNDGSFSVTNARNGFSKNYAAP